MCTHTEQRHLAFSQDGKQGFLNARRSGFRSRLSELFEAKEALNNARPYSASILAYATSFLYENGTLCYSTTDRIRILNLGSGNQIEKVISSKFFSQKVAQPGETVSSPALKPRLISLLGFRDEVLTVLCDFGAPKGCFLFAVNVADSNQRPRCLLKHHLRFTDSLFACHNSTHLYMGTLSARSSFGHQEWLVQGFDLSSGQKLTNEPIQLHDFAGTDLGTSVVFTVHDGCFYALSNQASHESEEVNWTSYYHYIRFAVDDEDPKIEIRTIYRRQDSHGPINDAWTDLGFQIDHETGELLIVECRKEWIGGGSSSARTYYVQPWDRAEHKDWEQANTLHPDAQVARTVTDKDNARFEMAPHERVAKYTHTEFKPSYTGDRREYLRAKTKWNGYDYNNQCYVDLVLDEVGEPDSWRKSDRIRLRVVSRKPQPPMRWTGDLPEGIGAQRYELRPQFLDRHGIVVQDSEDAFTESEVNLWPRDDMEVPKELDGILCPGGKSGDVKAQIGEEGLVYMVGPTGSSSGNGGEGCERALVLLSFEPGWGFEGMKRLDGELARPRNATCKANATNIDRPVQKRKACAEETDVETKRTKLEDAADANSSEEGATPAAPPTPKPQPKERLLWMEKAKYISIARGYWLR